jgi:hypothetical protein
MNNPARTSSGRRTRFLIPARLRILLHAIRWSALVALLPLFLNPTPAAAVHYGQGEKVQFIGVVADAQGRPLQGVRVVLEASRSYFSFKQFHRADKDSRRLSAESDAKGEYTIEWPWDEYFNHFKLSAGLPVRKGRSDTFHNLDEIDVTDRVNAGAPVVSTLEVHDRAFYDHLHAFLASVQSDDERRVFNDMGTPDDVKQVQYAGGSAAEVTWWYFESGKVFRFGDGKLEQTSDFAPVRPYSGGTPQEK